MIPQRLRRVIETLTYPHSLDTFTTAIHHRWTSELVATVASIEPLTPRASRIVLRTSRSWPGHTAGQYVNVAVEINGRREQRTYSITTPSSGPGSTEIAIGVQRVEGGLVSNHLLDRLKVGDLVHLGEPMGHFTLPANPNVPLLLIGAGSGMTPIRGLVADLEERRIRTGAAPEVTVLSFARSAEERMFHDELDAAAERNPWLTVRFLDTRTPGAALSPGSRLDETLLDEYCTDWRDRLVFVCGPESLLDTAQEIVDPASLVIERFTRLLPPREGQAAAPSVTVRLSNASAEFELPTDVPLLDAIEASGQLAPSGCRNGICHTCSVEVLSGCAVNLRDGRVTEAGSHVQICISAPLTDLELAL